MYEARVVHHIPGRMRIKVPFLKGAFADLERINQLLLPVEGLKHVDFSPVTGSVLLHYDPEMHKQFPKQLSEYVQRAIGVDLVPATPTNGTPEGAATQILGDTKLAREVYSFFSRINNEIKNATGDVFDLKSLLPFGLGAYALFKAGSTVTTPLWVTLAIFSFTSFAILNPVPITVATDEKQGSSSRDHNATGKKKNS
jgi:hypothetical protein